jgi:iron complex outermembrane receptor protein
VKNQENDKWQARNISQIESRGWENNLNYRIDKHLISLQYLFLKENQEENTYTYSRYNLNAFKHQASLQWSYYFNTHWKSDLSYKYLYRPSGTGISLAGAGINYRNENLEIGARAYNLLDTEYYEANLVPMPGRHLRIHIAYKY